MFVPVSGIVPDLHKPDLIHRVLKEFPLGVFENAMMHDRTTGNSDYWGARLGPCAVTMLDPREWENYTVGEYHPGETDMVELFLGNYYRELARLKGYVAWDGDTSLRYFVSRGKEAFRRGYAIPALMRKAV